MGPPPASLPVNVCPYGDPHCPCPDGDPCHYEGDDPMTPPTDEEKVIVPW